MSRSFALVVLYVSGTIASSAQSVLINEVMAANRIAVSGPAGDHPDWVELYNTAPRTADLSGMRLVRDGRQFIIPEGLRLAPKKHVVFWCGNDPDELPFPLPRAGTTLLLIGADGIDILDVFTFPDLPPDVSFGRLPDGASTWSYFLQPTPEKAATKVAPIRDIAATPSAFPASGRHVGPVSISLFADTSCTIRYTLDGSRPSANNGELYTGSVVLNSNAVLRAQAVRAGSLESDVFCATYLIGTPAVGPALSLTMDPRDLYSDPTGIDTYGSFANYSRSGREWERPVEVWMEGGSATVHAGIRIAGSGSRSLEKRSYKLMLRSRFESPDSGFSWMPRPGLDECMLRAAPFPNAYLRNTCIEALVRRSGIAVDVQPSVPVMLYLNGEAHGLYRAMAPKDEQWVRSLGGAEAVDLLEGPASVAMSGDREHYTKSIALLVDGAPREQLEAMIDLNSLFDLAATDVYTGRADHDINVRCWRAKTPEGRWRWILYDQDLWAPITDNSVERMCSARTPEAPFLPEILAHHELRPRFLARYAALMHTAFSPRSFTGVVDSVYAQDRERMQQDFARWGEVLGLPSPEACPAELHQRAEQRPQLTLEQLARKSGMSLRPIDISVSPKGAGTLRVEGLAAGEHFEGDCFAGVALSVEAEAGPGMEFVGWKGSDQSGPLIRVDPAEARKLKAVFRERGSGRHLP